MITFFNRKELISTISMKQQSDITDLLSANNIDYSVKVINRNSPLVFADTRARTGTFGQNMDSSYEYIIYVHKKDYSTAKSSLK